MTIEEVLNKLLKKILKTDLEYAYIELFDFIIKSYKTDKSKRISLTELADILKNAS